MKRHRTKSWDTDDITLQSLYGLSLFDPTQAHPRFGSGVTMPLSIGALMSRHKQTKEPVEQLAAGTSLLPPTMLNLAWHFGYMQWAMDNIATLIRQSKGKVQGKDLDDRFFLAAQDYARTEFEQKRVDPLRKALHSARQPMYFYCVPSVSIATELVTGQPLMVEGDRILCILPKSVNVAKYYGLSDAEIYLIAPQVIWLIKNMCSFRAIRTPAQLVNTINGWTDYLNPAIMQQVQGSIQSINPHLITEQVSQALLPF